MNAISLRKHCARTLRGLGYMIVVLQWLWIAMIVLPQLIENDTFNGFFDSTPQTEQQVVQAPPMEANGFTWTIAIIIVALILTVTILALLKIPKAIVKSGDKIVSQAAETIVPVITHHQPVPVEKRRLLSRKIVLGTQLSVSLLPLSISFFIPAYEELSTDIILILATTMAVGSVTCFLFAWLVTPKSVKV